MENIKLTEEEIQQLQEIQNQQSVIINELGQISLLEINLSNRKKQAEAFLIDLQSKEEKVGKELNEKYGDGTINLTKGEFIPQK